tara:strand:- start:515 stop:940 length:426 start_codon:yes stop_codon:yes gene_type:complete
MNKKQIIGIVIILVLIIGGFILYNSLKKDYSDLEILADDRTESNVEADAGAESGEAGGNLGTQKPVPEPDPNNLYVIIDSLDETRCSVIEVENMKNRCINGISLIEKAQAANDFNICFDPTIRADPVSRSICIQKLQEGQE